MSDLIERQKAIEEMTDKNITCNMDSVHDSELHRIKRAVHRILASLPSVQPEYNMDEWCTDCKEYDHERHRCPRFNRVIRNALKDAQPEPLTDKEQRIFLAAMGREEKVCEEVDRNYVREPYEDSLVRVCKEIRRKVKGALWI